METPTHTPKPWNFEHNPAHPGKIVVYDSTHFNRHVAYLPIDAMPDGEQEANARLIAASPDLLEACERLLKAFYKTGKTLATVSGKPTATQLAEAAIAKALAK